MASCVQPGQLSPGHLFINYAHTTQALLHSLSVRWKFGVDLNAISARAADADRLALAVANCVTNAFAFTTWGIKDNTGRTLYTAALPTPYTGFHAAAAGVADLRSRTVTVMGAGIPAGPGNCYGKCLLRFFTGQTYDFIPGQKFIAPGFDTHLDALQATLNTSSNMWADFYGQPGATRGPMPVQFNAHTQRKAGS